MKYKQMKYNPNNKKIQELWARYGSLTEQCEEDDSFEMERFETMIELVDLIYVDAQGNQGAKYSGKPNDRTSV